MTYWANGCPHAKTFQAGGHVAVYCNFTSSYDGVLPILLASLFGLFLDLQAPQEVTYVTETTPETNAIAVESLDRNYHIKEEVHGPRNCPSLESKCIRYPHFRHRVFLEPEGTSPCACFPRSCFSRNYQTPRQAFRIRMEESFVLKS